MGFRHKEGGSRGRQWSAAGTEGFVPLEPTATFDKGTHALDLKYTTNARTRLLMWASNFVTGESQFETS